MKHYINNLNINIILLLNFYKLIYLYLNIKKIKSIILIV